MSKNIEIKDKNRSKNKVAVLVLIGIMVLFILVRIVAISNSTEGGIAVLKPELDSINLENNKSKSAQYDKEHEEEEAMKNNLVEEPEPSNYDFKKMFSVSGKTTEPEPIEEKVVVEKNNNSYGKYTPVKAKEENDYEQPVAKVKKAPVEKEMVVEEKQVVVSNPFGTFSSNKVKSKSGASSAVSFKDSYKCFLHSDQKIINGGGAIFRAGEDIVLENKVIKKNSILYGSANYQGQRVQIKINRVKSPEGEYAVNLLVYDNDFVKGIFFKNAYDEIPEKTTDDIANDGSSVNVGSGIVGTAAKMAVKAGKNVGDAIKKERALHLQEGYIIYIKEVKQNEN